MKIHERGNVYVFRSIKKDKGCTDDYNFNKVCTKIEVT